MNERHEGWHQISFLTERKTRRTYGFGCEFSKFKFLFKFPLMQNMFVNQLLLVFMTNYDTHERMSACVIYAMQTKSLLKNLVDFM